MDSKGPVQPKNPASLQNIQSNTNTRVLFSSKQLITVALLGLLFGLISYGIGVEFLLHLVVLALILQKLKVANYIQIVVLATVSLYSAPSFFALTHINTVVLGAVVGLLNALAYGFFYWFFNALKFDPTNKLIIAVVVAALAMTGSTYLSDKVSVQQHEEERQSKIENYDIGDDPSPFRTYIFNASWERFKPHIDCGSEYPNDILTFDFPCEEIGETLNGDKIYHRDSGFSNQYNTYVKIDNSIVVLATNSKHFTNSDLIKITGSLKPTAVSEFQALL